jgi:hypothetical protein
VHQVRNEFGKIMRNDFAEVVAYTRVLRQDGGMSENETPAPRTAATIIFLRRGDELMWVTRHDAERLIRATFQETRMPDGMLLAEIREMHVPRTVRAEDFGPKMARLFDSWVLEYVAAGWTVDEMVLTPSRSPEPWDIRDPLSRPCPF